MKLQKWLNENTCDLTGKTIAITGSTGELAKYVVKTLASLNANFIFINRDETKTQQQIINLTTLFPNIQINFIQCDLSNFQSVKIATEILKQKHIDILYLAAGVYNVERFKSDTGFDNIFQTNFVSQYYMVKELLPTLNEHNGKVVAVSSIALNYSSINENDIDFSNQPKHSKVYGNSKRFLTFALSELMKNQTATLSIVHPGITLTPMTNHYPRAINWLVKLGIKLFFPSIKMASLSLVIGIFDNTTPQMWIAPKIFNVWGKPKKQNIKKIQFKETEKIFEISEMIYKNLK